MRKVLRSCLGVLVLYSAIFIPNVGVAASSDTTKTKLDYFNGGALNLEFFMSNWYLMGAGQKAGALGGIPCTFKPNVEDVLNNPAGIGYIKKAGLMLDYTPPLPLPLDKILGLEEMVQEAETENMDKKFDLPADFEQNKTTIAKSATGQRGDFSGVAFALPLRYVNIGFGITNPFDMRLKVLGSGIEITMVEDLGGIPLIAALSVDMILDFNMHTNMTTIGVAREFGAGFAGGITLDKYDAALDIVAEAVPQGIITTNSAFPLNDGDFTQSVRGNLRGSGYGTRIGLSYHAPKLFSLDLLYSLVPSLTMDGLLVTKQYTYPLFDVSGLKDDSWLNIEGIDVTNPLAGRDSTATIYDGMILNMPSSFAVAIGLHGGSVGVGFGYKKYFNELSFALPDGNTQGLKYKSDFTFALDTRYFRMGLGVVTFDAVSEGSDTLSLIELGPLIDSLELPVLALPKLTLGFSFPIGSAIDINTVLLSTPLLGVLKTTLTYNWDMIALEKRAKKVDPMALYDAATQLYESGKYWDAAFQFGSLATSFPQFSKNSAARFYIGESFFKAGYMGAANDAYTDLITRYADDPLVERVLLRQGQIKYRNADYDKVGALHAQILKDFPHSVQVEELAYLAGQGLLRQGKYKEAAALLGQVSAKSESFKYAQYSLGQCALYAEDGKGAVAAFKQVFAQPASTPAEKMLDDRTRLALGHLLFEMVDYPAALIEYAAVQDSIGSLYEQTLVGQAWVQVELKKYDEVAKTVALLLKNFPKGLYAAEANLLLGYCLSVERKYDAAIEVYKKAVTISSQPTGIAQTKIVSLRDSKTNTYKQAKADFKKAVAPAFRLAVAIESQKRTGSMQALQQDIALKMVAQRKAHDALDVFNQTVQQMDWNGTLLHDAQAALPTAEHMKQETDKAKADKEYEKKLKVLEQQMHDKLKLQSR